MAKKLFIGGATVELVDGLNVTFDSDGNVIILDDMSVSQSSESNSGKHTLIQYLEKLNPGKKYTTIVSKDYLDSFDSSINTDKVVDVKKFNNLSGLVREIFSNRIGEVVEFNLRGMSPKVTWSVGNQMGWKLSYQQRPNGNHFIQRVK